MLVKAKKQFVWYPTGISPEQVPAGCVCDVPDWLGKHLIEAGNAEAVKLEEPTQTEVRKKRGRPKK